MVDIYFFLISGTQDQAIAIVAELCEANRLKQINSEIQRVCLMLLQTMEMGLYLELCVLQICGIRPVLGRVDDFSKEIKLLMKGNDPTIFETIIKLNCYRKSFMNNFLFTQLRKDMLFLKDQ